MINPSFKELEKIDKSRYALVVMTSKRARRIVNGSKNLMETDAQKPITQDLVDKFAGTGDIKRIQTTGKWINKQFFMNDVPIGYVIDEETKKEILTRRFAIHYSKDKGTHIVPILEKR